MELLSLGLLQVQRRAASAKDFIFSLWITERQAGGFSMTKVRSGVDGALAAKAGAIISILATGAEQAHLGAFPVPLHFLEDGNALVRAESLEEFVASASESLDKTDDIIKELRTQAQKAE